MPQTADSPATDPAFEFASLASKLAEHASTSSLKADEGFASFCEVDADSPYLFELISIMSSRSIILFNFIDHIEDEFVDDDLRLGLKTSVQNIAQVFSPTNTQERWSGLASRCIRSSDVRALKLFSQTARRYRKLRLLSKDERVRLLEVLDESIDELTVEINLPAWAVAPLLDGVRRLEFMIEHFDIFGHDQVIDQLLKIDGEVKATSSFLDTMKGLSEHRLVKTAGLFSLAVNLLILPPRIVDGVVSYRGYVHQMLEHPPKMLGPPLKRLTGPETTTEST